MWTNLRKSRAGLPGLFILALVVLCALAAPWIAPHDPYAQNLADAMKPPFWSAEGSAAYLLGTDQLGRDIFSRIIYGSRISLLISAAGSLVSLATGILLGSISGYYGGKIDSLLMRFVDISMAVPFILLSIFIAAIVGPGIANIIFIAGISSGVGLARLVRGEIMAVKGQEYIEAIRSVGANDRIVVFRHILPNISYTRGLLRSIPSLSEKRRRLETIAGSVPAGGELPSGCAFHPRCPYRRPVCESDDPEWTASGDGGVKCWMHTKEWETADV